MHIDTTRQPVDAPEITSPDAGGLEARVALDARYLDGEASGIGRYTEHLVEEVLELDETVSLHLVTHPRRPRPVDHPRVTCETFGASANSLRTRFLLARSLDLAGVDLFHSPFNMLPADLPVPATMTLHDIMWLLDPGYCTDSLWRRIVTGTFYRQMIPRSVADADRIFTVSHHSRRAIEERFPAMEGAVDVTYNGLDSFFHPVEPERAWPLVDGLVPPGARFVLVVGQGSPYKNHAGALAGFAEAFGAADDDVYFVLVRRFTRGPARRLERLMQLPALRDRIILVDHYISGEQLRALYGLASVFLFPSLYEGFGLPALEAMACATPVVTSDRGAPAEVCGEGAVRVDPEDPTAIGAELRRLVDDEDYAGEMRRRGLARAAEFSWRNCARQALRGWRAVLHGA